MGGVAHAARQRAPAPDGRTALELARMLGEVEERDAGGYGRAVYSLLEA